MSYRLEILHGSSYGPSRHKGHPCKEKLAWNPCKKIPWTMELAITQPFFELDNQDFAWKFVWTIQKNGHPCKEKSAWKSMQENSMDHGISYNSAIFRATDSRFCMEVHMDRPVKMGIHTKKNWHGIHARKFHGPWN